MTTQEAHERTDAVGTRLEDVARVAGVSHQTVSRVINGSARVAPATRDRVLEAVAELGLPAQQRGQGAGHPEERRHRRGRGGAGLLRSVEHRGGPGAGGPRRGLRHGPRLPARGDPEATQEALDHLVCESVEAIVLIAPDRHRASTWASGHGCRSRSWCSTRTRLRARLSVGVDHEAGARLATQHLIDLGHATSPTSAARRTGTRPKPACTGGAEALEEAGLPASEPLVGDWTASSGYRLGRRLAAASDVTAIFVANDQMSIGAAARPGRGRSRGVPERREHRRFRRPPRVRVLHPAAHDDPAELRGARVAGRMGLLTSAIRGERDEGTVRRCPPKLVVRASTGRPRRHT